MYQNNTKKKGMIQVFLIYANRTTFAPVLYTGMKHKYRVVILYDKS